MGKRGKLVGKKIMKMKIHFSKKISTYQNKDYMLGASLLAKFTETSCYCNVE